MYEAAHLMRVTRMLVDTFLQPNRLLILYINIFFTYKKILRRRNIMKPDLTYHHLDLKFQVTQGPPEHNGATVI